MPEIRDAILSLENSLKVLSNYFDGESSTDFKALEDQIHQLEKRWSQLISNLERIDQEKEQLHQTQTDSTSTTISTTFDETNSANYEKVRSSSSLTMKSDFDLSARKYLDWIDSIERILNEKSAQHVSIKDRREIIEVKRRRKIRRDKEKKSFVFFVQEVKTKYSSYDEQFQHLLQTGHVLIGQLTDGNDIPVSFICLIRITSHF